MELTTWIPETSLKSRLKSIADLRWALMTEILRAFLADDIDLTWIEAEHLVIIVESCDERATRSTAFATSFRVSSLSFSACLV